MMYEDTMVATPPATIDGVAGEVEGVDEEADGAKEAVASDEADVEA